MGLEYNPWVDELEDPVEPAFEPIIIKPFDGGFFYGVATGEQGTGVGDLYQLSAWYRDRDDQLVGVTMTQQEIDIYTVFETTAPISVFI